MRRKVKRRPKEAERQAEPNGSNKVTETVFGRILLVMFQFTPVGLSLSSSPFPGRSTPRRSSSAPYSHILDLEVKDERPTGREDEPREMGCGAVSWIPL